MLIEKLTWIIDLIISENHLQKYIHILTKEIRLKYKYIKTHELREIQIINQCVNNWLQNQQYSFIIRVKKSNIIKEIW